MPTEKPRILFAIEEAMLQELDNIRRAMDPIPSRAEVVRQLLAEALQKRKATSKPTRKG